jgi:hypothetical protein
MDMYAVIPSYNRPKELRNLIGELHCQGVPFGNIKVIVAGEVPEGIAGYVPYFVLRDEHAGWNPEHIYRHWNHGLDWAANEANGRPHCVAILNDDVCLPDNFVPWIKWIMNSIGPTIAFPNQHGRATSLLNCEPGPTPLTERVTGYAFVVNGQHGIRLDTDFVWWYGDDDLDWRARADYSGTYLVQGVTVEHLYPSQSTVASAELSAQAGRDRETFIRKHGRGPW